MLLTLGHKVLKFDLRRFGVLDLSTSVAFDEFVADLCSFHDTWVAAESANGVRAAGDLGEGFAMYFIRLMRGEIRVVDDASSDDAEAANEREPIFVDSDVVGCLVHEVSYRVMSEQQSPDFLLHEGGFFGSEHSIVRDLVGLDLIEADLKIPAFGVKRGEFGGGAIVVVGEGGDEADNFVRFAVGESVLDNANRDLHAGWNPGPRQGRDKWVLTCGDRRL